MELKVKIIVADPTDETLESIKSQTYKCDVVGFSGGNASESYNNSYMLAPRYDIYGFLNGKDKFIDNKAVEKIVEQFSKNIDLVGIVYCDKYLEKDGLHIMQIYPAFEVESLTIFNPTMFINGRIETRLFDPKLNHLRFYDVIRKVGMSAMVKHIPETLIESKFTHSDIKEELEYVRQSS